MSKYIVMLDASPPWDFEGCSGPGQRDARDVMVMYHEGYIDTGLLNEKGVRIMRTPREIGFNRE